MRKEILERFVDLLDENKDKPIGLVIYNNFIDNPEYADVAALTDEYLLEILHEALEMKPCNVCGEFSKEDDLIDTEQFVSGGVGLVCPGCYEDMI